MNDPMAAFRAEVPDGYIGASAFVWWSEYDPSWFKVVILDIDEVFVFLPETQTGYVLHLDERQKESATTYGEDVIWTHYKVSA